MYEAELEVAVKLVSLLRAPLEELSRRDRSLASQMRRATCTLAINLNEARHRRGKEREALFREAAESVAEAHTVLYLAETFGHLTVEITQPARELLNQELVMLSSLTDASGH